MSVFSKVGGLKPSRTAFPLRHSNLVDMDFGKLYPVDCIEVVPGDVFKMPTNIVGRLSSSLDSPILANIDLVIEAFFTPLRLLMGHDANFETPVGEDTFESFIRGGKDGNSDIPLPRFGLGDEVTFGYGGYGEIAGIQPNAKFVKGALHDDRPLVFEWRAYRNIWNEFYRVEGLMDEVQVCQYLGNGLADDLTRISDSEYDSLFYRSWRRDYFTSSLPYQQFGTAPAFDISGILPVQYSVPDNMQVPFNVGVSAPSDLNSWIPFSGTANYAFPAGSVSAGGVVVNFPSTSVSVPLKANGNLSGSKVVTVGINGSSSADVPLTYIKNSTSKQPYRVKGEDYNNEVTPIGSSSFTVGAKGFVDLSQGVSFDVNDLRTGIQIQKWMERNARGGVRYTEYLQSHFGVSPSDFRLQRPEFIGSMRCPWIVSEVLQTSASSDGTTPQGNQAGQAIVLGRGHLGKYRAYEYGYITIIASIVPKPMYQQGIPKRFSRFTRFDYYSPEFAHLSEQAVLNKEIYVSGDQQVDNGIFGFQGIFNELRYLPSRVSNHMKSGAPTYSFDYWHLARVFSETPVLNKEFLQIGATTESLQELKRIFAVQDENPFIVDFGFNFTGIRPLPYLAEPGLMDHF